MWGFLCFSFNICKLVLIFFLKCLPPLIEMTFFLFGNIITSGNVIMTNFLDAATSNACTANTPPHILRKISFFFFMSSNLWGREADDGGCTAASRLINIKMSPLTRSIKSSSYIHCRVMKSSCSLSYWPSSYKVAAAAVKYIFHGLLNAIVASLLILQSRSTNEMKNLFKYIHSSDDECAVIALK